MKKKLDLVAGKKYRGYGYVNEYGEFEFTPEETGSRKDRQKVLTTGLNYSVSTTSRHLVVHFKLKKGKASAMLQQFVTLYNTVWTILRNYEF